MIKMNISVSRIVICNIIHPNTHKLEKVITNVDFNSVLQQKTTSFT